MNAKKLRVAVRLESESEGQSFVQNLDAELYPKGDHAYLRYKEVHPELGDTAATIRLSDREIRLIRQGDVESEQIFIPGAEHSGMYTTSQGRLPLVTVTEAIESSLQQGLGRIQWTYKLNAAGNDAGTFTIKLTIREANV